MLRKEGECRLPASLFRANARNLFRLRSGKRGEEGGERETRCSMRLGRTVLHADNFTKENGNGKRKRSLGCARDDETRKRFSPFFIPLRKPTSAPFGAPPSRGRRENAVGIGLLFLEHRLSFHPVIGHPAHCFLLERNKTFCRSL